MEGSQPVVDRVRSINAINRIILRKRLWAHGDIEYNLRPDGQSRAYEFLLSFISLHPDDPGPVVFNCHRRFGKTYLWGTIGIMNCLRNQNYEFRYGAPTEKQAKEIVEPILKEILRECPDDLRPKKVGNTWTFRNPMWGDPQAASVLTLFGCKENADAQRGKGTDMVVIDEARDVPDLQYVITDVFGFQFVGRKAPLMAIITTPPRTRDHAFVREIVPRAVEAGSYFVLPASQNKDWSARDDRMLERFCGGKNNTSWRREVECELISDEESLIIPQFSQNKEKILSEIDYQTYHFPYVFIDSGFAIDYTAILWAYLHFESKRLVVVDEFLSKGMSSGDISKVIRDGEERCFKDSLHPTRRIGDFTPAQIEDLRRHFGVSIRPAEKWDRESAVSTLQTSFWEDKIRINPRCKRLIYQLENGIRDDKGDFVRSEELGHCDAIAALVYGHRLVLGMLHQDPRPQARHIGYDLFNAQSRPMVEKNSPEVVITRKPLFLTKGRIA